jgi:hypothetical protein
VVVSGSATTASRGPAWASRTTVWPAATTCPGSPQRFDNRSIHVRDQNRVGRLILGDPCLGFGGGELRLGRIQRGPRLLVTLSGDPSFVAQTGVAPFIGVELNDRGARRGDGVVLRRERKAKIGFVDPHQGLPGFDLLADIHQPFHDLAGDAILIEVYRDILSGSVCSHYGHRWQCKLDTPGSINWTRWATRTGRLYSLWIEKVGVHAHLLDLVFLINAPLSQAH